MNYLEKVAMYENEIFEKIAINKASKLYRKGKLSPQSVDRLYNYDYSYGKMDRLADKARKIKTGQWGQKPATASRYKKFVKPSGKEIDGQHYTTLNDVLGANRKARFIGKANAAVMGNLKNQGIEVLPTQYTMEDDKVSANTSNYRRLRKIFDRNPNHQLSNDQYEAIRNKGGKLSARATLYHPEYNSETLMRRNVKPLEAKMQRTVASAHEISGELGAYTKGFKKLRGNSAFDDKARFGTHKGLRPVNIENKALHIFGNPELKNDYRDVRQKQTDISGSQQSFMDKVYGVIKKPRHKVTDQDMERAVYKAINNYERAKSLAAAASGQIHINRGSKKYRKFLE